jgi:indole-3-glycerol phosphate synthase
MSLLDDIIARKRTESARLAQAAVSRPTALARRDVVEALRRPAGAPLRLVAEIKYRSPSAGALSRHLGPAERARIYEHAGADVISVLTDETWFGGSFADLAAARGAVGVPILCKDFVVARSQIEHAWAAGADAVLLIVRCLRVPGQLGALMQEARAIGLEPFVEVVDEDELEQALGAGASVIGVNARDLDTLQMDAQRVRRVLARIPRPVVAVHLSGLKTFQDAADVAASRADAALIGEALMRCDDPEPLLKEFRRGASAV